MSVKTDGFGRMLWRSGIPDCGCYLFTSPTQGVDLHCCPTCFVKGSREIAYEGEPEQLVLGIAAEQIAEKMLRD